MAPRRSRPKPLSTPAQQIVLVEFLEQKIFSIRGHRVMLDRDLAAIYGVSTKRLNEQVRRNRDRFPEDFLFRLTMEEATALFSSRSQIATLKRGQNPKYAPYAFIEHGAVMAANVLNSPVAVRASIQVVRAFVRLREILATHKDLARKLEEMEKKYDAQFRIVFDALRKLAEPTQAPSARRMGFLAEGKGITTGSGSSR